MFIIVITIEIQIQDISNQKDLQSKDIKYSIIQEENKEKKKWSGKKSPLKENDEDIEMRNKMNSKFSKEIESIENLILELMDDETFEEIKNIDSNITSRLKPITDLYPEVKKYRKISQKQSENTNSNSADNLTDDILKAIDKIWWSWK